VKKERVEHEPIMVSRDIGGAALSGAFSGAQAKGSVPGAISPREEGFPKGRRLTSCV